MIILAKKMSFIAIDIGASFIKGAILDDKNFKISNIIRLPFPSFIKSTIPFYREVNPSEIIKVVRVIIGQLFKYISKCSAIFICGQMHGLVLINEILLPGSRFYSFTSLFYDLCWLTLCIFLSLILLRFSNNNSKYLKIKLVGGLVFSILLLDIAVQKYFGTPL